MTTRNHRTTDAHFQLRLYDDHATCSSFELLSKNTAERRARRFEPYETNATKRVTQVPTGDSRSLSLVSFSRCPPRSYTYTIQHTTQEKLRPENASTIGGEGGRSRRRRPKVRVTTSTTNYELRTTNHGLRTTNHGLRTTNHGLRTAKHGSRITDHGPWTTDYGPRTVTRRSSQPTLVT